VLRASSWLAPSRSTSPCGLPRRKTRDASNRLLPPERMTCTRSPYVLDSLERLSPPGMPRNSLWLSRCVFEGTSVFTTPEPLWPHFLRGPPNALSSCLRPCGFRSRAWAYWTRGARWDETSDTSVANPSSSSRSRHLRACSRFLSRALMVSGQRVRVGRVRNPPRPPSPPAREDQKLEMIRGAFHR
jgi:hypothetical protein